jgi:osmoprotectant transport system permease protein
MVAMSSLIDAWTGREFWEETGLFLYLLTGSLGIALLIGIPAGILLTRRPRLSAPLITVLGLLQTFPSLALLGLLIPLLGLGQPPTVFLAAVYSLFPIVMNTYVGIRQVPPAIRDAARGMGLTPWQVLWAVDLPLALPVILTGVRTAAVYAIGIITICALADAGGLGRYLARGMARSDNLLIGIGGIPLLVLTALLFWGLGGIAWVTRKSGRAGLALGGGLGAVLAVPGVLLVADVARVMAGRLHEPGMTGLVSAAPQGIPALFDIWVSQAFWQEAGIFLSPLLGGLGIALLLGLGVGILLSRVPRVSAPVISGLALVQTFPSLALLGFAIPWVGIGQKAAVFLVVVYSLFPVVMNTYVGITQVPAAIRDAARGMGMNGRQVLWAVDLPLAMPVILAGVRTAAVYAISIVTVCAFAGAGGLGLYIVEGMERSDFFLLGVGAVPLLVLTTLIFGFLSALAWLSQKNARLGLALGGGLICLLSGYAAAEWLRPRANTIRLASKNFVEGQILTEIVKQMLESHTDLRVEVVPYLTPNVIYKAIYNAEIDLYPEYTGNLLTNKDALDLPVPADKSTITALVRSQMRVRYHLDLLPTFGLNNTYALCVPKSVARTYHLRTISDLRHAPDLRTFVDIDFLDRPDGWQGLVKTYGLHLPRPKQVIPSFRYRALPKDADMVCGFATDWEIDALDLVVLADDRHYFPNYHAAPLIRDAVLQRHPEIGTVLDRLKGQIDDRTMRRLNYQVAWQKKPVADVARAFLRERGLLKPAP